LEFHILEFHILEFHILEFHILEFHILEFHILEFDILGFNKITYILPVPIIGNKCETGSKRETVAFDNYRIKN
jgi:hypothetical protein